ncbi:MAG: ComF family protein [Clostridiales bacterium]|nr:ComF family protein [Clostridiales bacterium]
MEEKRGKFKRFFGKVAAIIDSYDDTHNFTCDVCGREVFGGERVCATCLKELPWNNAEICPFCGRKVKEAGTCLECKEKLLITEKARSAFTHEGEAMRLVIRFKNGNKYLVRTLAELLFPLLEREFAEADAVTFVPMTEKDEKKRGYNQSKLLAERLAQMSGKEFLNAAIKQRQTDSQKTLGRKEREKNLERCFHVTDRAAVKGKKILIIDDTLTTGATSSELADTLKRAGAKTVYLLTATSVEKKDPFGIK